jgi:1-acyl-sn-glycerol-3-phosphate acyltransferase
MDAPTPPPPPPAHAPPPPASGQAPPPPPSPPRSSTPRDESVQARVERIEIPFNQYGVDPYGISKRYLAAGYAALALLYKRYFSVKVHGIQHVPARGRAMLIGNHSGGVALDGAMVIASCFFEMEPPRLAQGMAEKFINRIPFASMWASRTGQFTGVPEIAERLLREGRLLMVFPEGARGTAKLWKERYSLVEFGTGFMRLAMKTQTPIVPFGFVGGADAIPTVANLYALGRLVGVPYVPVTPWLVALPRPTALEVVYGEPLEFSGTGDEDDEVIVRHVELVKARIAELIERARKARHARVSGLGGLPGASALGLLSSLAGRR